MKKIYSTSKKVCCTLTVLLILSLGQALQAATNYYVATTGNNADPGTIAQPFLTIKYAISQASSGDIINVAAGNYIEAGQILIDKDLSIIGDDKTTTFVYPNANTLSNGAWILVDPTIDFNLSKFTLDGTGWLIYYGIKHQGSGTIDDCNIKEIKYNESGPEYGGTAILIQSTATVNVTNTAFTQIGRNGILADQCLGTYDNNTYTGKGAGDFLDYFIFSEYGDNVTISNNTVSDCRGVASSDGSASSAMAVWDDPGTQAIITGNTLTNNSAGIVIVGINGGTSDPKVVIGAGNLIVGGDYGIAFETFPSVSHTPDVTFTGLSTLKGQTVQAIYVGDGVSNGAIIDASSLEFRTAGGVLITDNFTIEDLVYHATDATNRAFIKWNGTNAYVTTLSGSIQRAINAVLSSWTVNVGAGVFAENVTINKSLDVRGANYGIAGCSGLRGAESTIAGGLGTAVTIASNGVTLDGFKITGATGVSSTGFTKIGIRNNKFSVDAVGVGASAVATSPGNTYTIEDNCIDLNNQVIGVSTTTVGIFVNGATGTASVTVDDNTVTDAFYGYVVNGVNTSPVSVFSDGIITGVLQGVAVVNTIGGPLAPSNVLISGMNMSAFSGNYLGLPAQNFHAGVYTFTAGSTIPANGIITSIQNCTIDGTQSNSPSGAGIYLADFSTGGVSVQTSTINECTLSNNSNRGLDVRGYVNATVTNSTFTGNGNAPYRR